MRVAIAALLVGAMSSPALAQEPVEIEIPVLILPDPELDKQAWESALDLANIVQTAARGITTVQEAPAIVTVITDREIRDRGFTNFVDIIDTIPAWYRGDGFFGQFPYVAPRGTIQTILYMRNGVSLQSPFGNISIINRVAPLENIKRIEVVTGPGGVLWGANSYLGVINVVTKRAADLDGIEAEVAIGDGRGDRAMLRGWVMGGVDELFKDVSFLLHASFQTFQGRQYAMPQVQFAVPPPLANAPLIFGEPLASDQARSTLFSLSGTAEVKGVDIHFSVPFVERHMPLGFIGTVVSDEVPNQLNWLDRYVTAEWTTRLADSKVGLGVKAYGIQFERSFQALAILPPSDLLEDGLSFEYDGAAYRVGGAVDGDVLATREGSVLYGVEAFREWIGDNTQSSRQGAGIEARVITPADHSRIPLPCPLQPDPDTPGQAMFIPDCPLTFMFQTDRTVLGAYLNPRWRPSSRLAFDVGARYQLAPDAFSDSAYDPVVLFSGAAVMKLAKGYHAKLNYTEGFRPPVFQNTASNGEAIQIDGARDLKTETSRAVQLELNGRVLKGVRGIREVSWRADYSYTVLDDLIQVVQGRYENTATRDIHSAELLAKLYLSGGHRLELSYTWQRMNMEDKGVARHIPEHFFRFGGVFHLHEDLEAFTLLGVMGSYDDPNLIVEYRPLDPGETVSVRNSEMVLDRLPPQADLSAGVTYSGIDRLRLRATAYNMFSQYAYYMDTFGDYEPRFEFLPNPRPGFRFVLSASYTY